MTRIEPGGRAVLFAFDDQSIPWRYRVRLEMHRPEKYDGNPVIARGPSRRGRRAARAEQPRRARRRAVPDVVHRPRRRRR